jgi:glycosyltransferase involved in cell wall biosynthesis
MATTVSGGPLARPLRVLIVTDQYEPMVGGVPTVTRELAAGLGERGHAVTVLAPSPDRRGHRRGPRDGEAAVDLRGSLSWPWYPDQRLGLLPPRQARALLTGFDPDVVHLHSPLTLGAAARSAARRRPAPVVYTNHYLPQNVWPAGPAHLRPILREAAFYACLTRFANRCDQVTAPSATALRLLREHGLRAPAQTVSNGIDRSWFQPGTPDPGLRARYALPPGRPVVLAVGRLSQEKRVDVLVAALARLADTGDGPLLALAGAGPDEGRLRALARHYGVASRVRFLGFVPDADLPGLYRLADVFAIASEAELQSLATLAALASGLPVAAADAGALPELVHAGENGLLARPGRADELADCLALLCRDARLRARMGRASARIAGEHDRGRVLDRWESLYRALAWPAAGRPLTERNGTRLSDARP